MSRPSHRPDPVTLVAALVVLEGVLVVAAGVALVVFRDNELEQIPALLARVDEVLPFDSGQDLGSYMSVVGAVVVVLGLLLAGLGAGVLRGSRAAYLVVLVVLVLLAAGAAVLAAGITDELARLGLRGGAAVIGVTALLLALLLVGRSSRAWLLAAASAEQRGGGRTDARRAGRRGEAGAAEPAALDGSRARGRRS